MTKNFKFKGHQMTIFGIHTSNIHVVFMMFFFCQSGSVMCNILSLVIEFHFLILYMYVKVPINNALNNLYEF